MVFSECAKYAIPATTSVLLFWLLGLIYVRWRLYSLIFEYGVRRLAIVSLTLFIPALLVMAILSINGKLTLLWLGWPLGLLDGLASIYAVGTTKESRNYLPAVLISLVVSAVAELSLLNCLITK